MLPLVVETGNCLRAHVEGEEAHKTERKKRKSRKLEEGREEENKNNCTMET